MPSRVPPYQDRPASDPQCPGAEVDGVSKRGWGITASFSGFWSQQLSSSRAQGTWCGLYRAEKQATPPAGLHPSSSFLFAGTPWSAWAKRSPWASWTSCKFYHLLAYVYTV